MDLGAQDMGEHILSLVLAILMFPLFLVLGSVLSLIAISALILLIIGVLIAFVGSIILYFPAIIKQEFFDKK